MTVVDWMPFGQVATNNCACAYSHRTAEEHRLDFCLREWCSKAEELLRPHLYMIEVWEGGVEDHSAPHQWASVVLMGNWQ
jgi:hypothetical protein